MSLDQYPKLQEILENGYEFNLGDYISQGVDIFKRNIGNFVGYTLVAGLIFFVTAVIPLVNIFAYLILAPVLYVGFFLGAHRVARGEQVSFGDFFKGFDYTGQLVLWMLTLVVGMCVIMIPAGLAMYNSFSVFAETDPLEYANNPFWIYSMIPWWIYMMYLPLIYLGVSLRWAPLFIIFNKMNFWDALIASFRVTNKKFWMQLLFCVILYVLGNIGFIVLLIGLLFTYPAALCMDYAAFAQVTGLNRDDVVSDNLEEHLVE